MATTSPSLSEVTAFNKLTKGKRKKKGSKTKEETLTSKSKSKTKLSKESSSTELASSKPLVSRVHEPVWNTEYSEELSVPVPDLYPELSDSLPNMQESDTEQEAMTKVSQPHCHDSEDNVQCVPTSCGDNDLVDDSHNNPGTSQSQEDSQLSNSHSQTKRKRKLAKPRKVRKRKSTDHGQDTGTSKGDSEHPDHSCQVSGKQGTWAQCTISSCGKWRFLQNNVDPNEIPERWVCSMNQNDKYNECNASQETFDSQDGNLDVMYTPYTSGAIVWAKMVGYPWWPAMMEDDPDYGYYCETDEDDVTPVMYHVVFFDKEVSRTWVNAVCIRNFSCDDDPEDMGKVTFKGKNYRRKLTPATLAARRASELPLQHRLAEYGFAARYKGPIGKKAVEEKERSVSLEAEEFSDSVTESDIASSGNSYSSGNSGNNYSSPDEIKRVKPKIPPKSKTCKEKPANKPNKSKPKKVQKTKQTDTPNKKKETGKKKTKNTTAEALVATDSNSKECSPVNYEVASADCEIQPTDMNEPVHEQYIEGNQNKGEDTPVLTKELDPSVPSTLSTKTDSEEAICKNNKSVNKASVKKSADNNSSETKVVKKRRMSGEAQGGKKRKISKDAKAENIVLGTNSAESKEQKPDVNAVASSESLVKTQKKRNASEESKQKKKKAGNVDINHHDTAAKEVEGNNSEISSKSKLSEPKENQQGKNIGEKAKESVSQDKPVGEDAKADNQSLDTEVKGVSKRKDADCLNIKATKVSKKKRAASYEEKESRKSRNSNEEGASSSDISDHKGAPEDGVQPEQHVIPHKPSFALKRSPASTDVRVTLSENNSRKKSLPKLVKAFKPPIAKEGKGPKMPKLLKPQFVSPALAKTGGKHDVRKEEVSESNNVKKSRGTVKISKLKSKAPQKKDHNLGQTSKKTKEERDQANDILPDDLQAEIEEIDNDIASMQKELRVSDTSDTSISEDRIISPTADRQVLSDSPEF